MLPSVADLDLSRLDEHDRETLELIARPMSERDADLSEIASELGLDRKAVKLRLERLAANMRAFAGHNQLPPLPDEEYESLKASIARYGQLVPILTTFAGEVIDGHHRKRACAELELSPWCHALEADADADELKSLAFVVNLARRQLTASARGGLVEAALKFDPTRSDRAIAIDLGVSHPFVGKVRAALEQQGAVETVSTRRGRDGVEQPARRAPELIDQDALREYVENDKANVLEVKLPAELVIANGSWLLAKAVRLRHHAGGYVLEIKR